MTQLTYVPQCEGTTARERETRQRRLRFSAKAGRLLGGTIKYDPSPRAERRCWWTASSRSAHATRSQTGRPSASQGLGLPYVADPGITRHLAQFFAKQAEALANRATPASGGRKSPESAKRKPSEHPSVVLFNGGVFKADPLRNRLLNVLGAWTKSVKAEPTREMAGADLDLAVARGAAYYGLVKRGKGVRIRGGTARAYYIGVATNMPAVPATRADQSDLRRAFGMEEGTEVDIPSYEVGLHRREAEFRFLDRPFAATTRPEPLWKSGGQIDELAPVKTTLEGKAAGPIVPVHLHSKVTPVGQLELWLHSRDGKQKWKLEFNVREGR